MTDEIIAFDTRDGIASLTFNRPEVRNAFNAAMYTRFFAMCDEVNRDRSIKVLIISGAGGKGFGAGGDIAMYQEHMHDIDRMLEFPKLGVQVLDTLDNMRVPTIAAVAGPATGGGASLALSCDLRIASPSARFGFPIARLGNCLGMRLYARLMASMGKSRVMDMIFTARLFDAAEAHAMGVFNYVTDDEESLLPRAEELARKLAQHAPLTLRATRESLRRLERQLLPPDNGDDLLRSCFSSRDFKEGVSAFVDKRKPEWAGE
ncbi:MAG TPA: enoyl-CoA hydratase [Candidatus Acidoferrum sp.]|jgi:enoyl-CoA hydratase|nr:enoyl-CoA hydratase [Candidatus Acidoferrum sp.]